MQCFEVWKNGQKLFIAGHPDALTLSATVAYHRSNAPRYMNVESVAWKEGSGPTAQDCIWEAPILVIGDEVTIKLIEHESPDPPAEILAYGMRKPPPWGSDEKVCSFCGVGKPHRKALFDGPKVKICDGCVDFYHQISERI